MKKTYIIGEMAWSHNGKLENAIKILKGLKASGSDAVSIHITDLDDYMTKNYRCISGQTLSANADNDTSIYEYLDKINLSNSDWEEFFNIAMTLNIDVIAMCNDYSSFIFSKKMKIKKYVVSAASFNEFDLIKEIIQQNNDIILRIGGATLEEIDNLVEFIFKMDENASVNILAGIQLYPTPLEQLQINSITILRDRYQDKNLTVGLADHIDGDNPYAIYLPGLAVALGANMLEKHITTHRAEKLEDFEAALGIEQFKEFVKYIRTVERSLGEMSLEYLINNSYQKYRNINRKKIVAARDVVQGEEITRDKITFKRSDDGLQLESLSKILGKKVLKLIKKDEGISLDKLVI